MPTTKKQDNGHYAAYAERRANSSMQMLAEPTTGMSMWVDVGTKEDVSLSKTASDWKVFCANRATTTIDTTLHNVVQRLFQATEPTKYQELMRAMWGDSFLDARVIEVIGSDPETAASMAAVAPHHRNIPSVFHKTHKRTSIKWFATLGKSKLSKASEFHLVEFVGLVYDSQNRIQAIYIYQESMGKTEDVPLPHQIHSSTTYDRVRVDGLLMKFEALELPSGGEYVMLSLALQRQPSLLDFGFKNPAEDLVFRFAKGFRAGLRRTPSALPTASLRFAETTSWVRDQDRPACSVCSRSFHSLVRRRHHCRKCGEVVCFQCSNLFAASTMTSKPDQSNQSSSTSDVRLCNRCVLQQQAEAGRHLLLGVLDANELKQWLDDELAENNPDLFDVPPPVTRRPLPSGGAFTGTLEVNALAATMNQLLDTGKWNPSTSTTLDASTDSITLGTMQQPPGSGGSGAASPPHPNAGTSSNHSPRTNSSQGRPSADNNETNHASTICLGAENRNFDAPYDGDDDRGNQSEFGDHDNGIRIVDPSERATHPPLPLVTLVIPPQPAHVRSTSSSSSRSLHKSPRPLDNFNLQLTASSSMSMGVQTAQPTPLRQTAHRRMPSAESLPTQAVDQFVSTTSARSLHIDPRYLPRHAAAQATPVRKAAYPLALLPPPDVSVRTASAWAGVTHSTTAAVDVALRDLHAKIGGPVHFLVVSFSDGCDAVEVMAALEKGAPGVPFIGGLSARGICDESAWVSMKRGGLVALWGIHDPHGSYTVASTGYDELTAKHNVGDAVFEAHRATPNPAFCLVYACPLVVDDALAGLRRVVQCPVLGGCSVLSAQYQGYLQISSAGGSTIGMTFALCSPSVETAAGWFSGYNVVLTKPTAQGVSPAPCLGVVTASDPQTKVVYEIDHRPAATVYKEWVANVHEAGAPMKFPRLGYMYPLGQIVHEALPSLQVNATPVVTAVDDVTGSLTLTTPIRTGTTVALMHTSADVLKEAVKRMAVSVHQNPAFDIADVDGCLMFLSAGVQVVLGSSMSMSGLVGAFKLWSGGASFLGLTSFGEVGHLAHEPTPLCDALMFSYLIFSTRRRLTHGGDRSPI